MNRISSILCVFGPAAILLSSSALAETGTLGNNLDIPVTYQAGIPDAQGNVAWESYTLQPCGAHEWSWTQGGQPNVHFVWPLWRDERKDEYGNVIMQRNAIPMSDQGGLTVFFPFGDQIWIDTSGAAKLCDGQEPAPSEPEVAAVEPTPTLPVAPATPAVRPPGGGQASSTIGVTELLAGLSEVAQAVERGELLLVEVDIGDNNRGRIVPIRVEDFTILLQLQVLSGEMSGSQVDEFLLLTGQHSKALLEQLILGVAAPVAKN